MRMRTSIVFALSSALGLAAVASCREHKWTRDVDPVTRYVYLANASPLSLPPSSPIPIPIPIPHLPTSFLPSLLTLSPPFLSAAVPVAAPTRR
ncbi:hypothetical protein F4809DRAFT_622539 [Biscogniauxia mediterranea]|nr:hypothetical protein F4809DRAFT_622539 [Biscogniauxia mediterranea]